MKIKRKGAIALVASALALMLLVCSAVVTYAYYLSTTTVVTNDGEKKHAKIGMNLFLLFDILNPDFVTTGTDLKIYAGTTSNETTGVVTVNTYKYDSTAQWGTAQNPYIISDIRHLQNLSVLWGIGYFDGYEDKFDPTKPADTDKAIPYFLVCKNDGSTVTIDGTGTSIAPIGDDEKPFVGYVGGAFKEGTKTTVSGYNSDVSAIYNLKVDAAKDTVDVGLFGTVSFLGDKDKSVESENDEGFGAFVGINSTIRDLLLYDVTVNVHNPSGFERIADLISNHTRMTDLGENHHLGILAGHAEFATVEFISVYYSTPSVAAFSVEHTKAYSDGKANYYSESGILGRTFYLNPKVNSGYISPAEESGSGTAGGEGTGGGALSGRGKGYVTAYEIFNLYHKNGNIVKYSVAGEDDATVDFIGLLVIKNGDNYTLEDGKTPVTVTVGTSAQFVDTYRDFLNQERTETVTWTDFVVKDGSNYYHLGRNTIPVKNNTVTDAGIVIRYGIDTDGEPLCTQWVRERILFGTQATNSYYFTDGVFTFALSGKQDTIEKTWKGADADLFWVGDNDSDKWEADYDVGSAVKGVVAYVSPIRSNFELQQVKNAPLVVLAKTAGNGIFLMTLHETSTKNGDNYYTLGQALSIADESYVQKLIEGYASGNLALTGAKDGFGNDMNITTDAIASYLENGVATVKDPNIPEWYAIDVGSSDLITELREQYRIKAESVTTAGKEYYVFFGTNPKEMNDMEDGVDYSTSQINISNKTYDVMKFDDGTVQWSTPYFYTYKVDNRTMALRCSATGNTNITTLTNSSDDPVGDLLKKTTHTKVRTEYGQDVYSITFTYDDNTVTYTGIVMIQESGTNYLQNGVQVTISNGTITPSTRGIYQYRDISYSYTGYFYHKVDTDTSGNKADYYYYVNPSGTVTSLSHAPTKAGVVGTGGTDGAAHYRNYTYTNGGTTYQGPYFEQLTPFQLSYYDTASTRNYLSLVYRLHDGGCFGADRTYYDLYCGPKSNLNSSKITDYSASTQDCRISFIDGVCHLEYTYGGFSRYVSYNSSGDGSFEGTLNVANATLYIYALEATQSVVYGGVGAKPTDSSTFRTQLSADQFVLWPDYSGSNFSAAVAQETTPDPVYYAVSLDQLYNLEYQYYGKTGELKNGWQNGDGNAVLQPKDLSMLLKMKEGASFGTTINFWNGQLSSDGFITADVGSLGVKANIPQGCVAFRVNKDCPEDEEGYFIRVIVAVPLIEHYKGEKESPTDTTGYQFPNGDYYLGVWQVEAGGESTIQSFDANGAMTKIELPRSSYYNSDKFDNEKNDANNYVELYYDAEWKDVKTPFNTSTTYRTYLSASRVLVAYAFRIYKEGVYVIGAVNPDSGAAGGAQAFPMEIAFLSADAAASEGHDGIQGSKMGSIDFVYANETDVITVKATSGDGGTTDYTKYYYASLSTLYTDNYSDSEINDFECYIRRTSDATGAVLTMETKGADGSALDIERYFPSSSDRTKIKHGDGGYVSDPSS